MVEKYVFPGVLFPCYRNRVGEDGEVLPPPTLSELLRFEADNAKGDEKAPSYLNGRIRGYLAFDSGKSYYYKWLIVINFAVMYNLIFTIGRACFWELENAFPLGWIILDYTSDFLYLLDIFVRAHEGYLEQGILVKDSKMLRAAYRRSSWFKKDMISILPTDFLYFLFPGKCYYQIPCKVIVRLNRIVKIERMFQFFDKTETTTNFPNAFRILKIVFYILVLIHWNACVYFTVSFYIGFNTDSWVYQVGAVLALSTLSSRHVRETRPCPLSTCTAFTGPPSPSPPSGRLPNLNPPTTPSSSSSRETSSSGSSSSLLSSVTSLW